jgi:phosphoglycerate dehydrogenase-like enzyme
MDVAHEDWRERHTIYFDGAKFAERINAVAADVLIVEADLVHEEVLNGCDLRLIGCCRGDPINVGVARATELGIPVLFTPGRNADAVADLTLGFMLALARHIYTVNWLLKSGQMTFAATGDYLKMYGAYGGFELGGITVGVVGFGAIGRRVVERVRAFGSTVLVYDPFVTPDVIAAMGARAAELDEVVAAADMLTLHCPDTPENYGLISAARTMKPAKTRHATYATRYTTESSTCACSSAISPAQRWTSLPTSRCGRNRYVQLPNVLVSPHLGGATRDVVQHQSDLIVDGIEAWLRGERPATSPILLCSRSEDRHMAAIVALDAGTGGAKCTIFDLDGRRLGTHSEGWTYSVVANRDVPLVKEYSFDAGRSGRSWRAASVRR